MQPFPPLIKFALVNAITSIVKPLPLIFLLSIFSYISCTDSETARNKNVNPAEIYFDYKIRGQENDSTVSVYLLYRMGGPNGNPIRLSDPAKVELDSETIKVDSAKLAGAYYDIEKNALDFKGSHTIVFTDFDGRQFKEELTYKPFKLKTKIPTTINRSDLTFDFT